MDKKELHELKKAIRSMCKPDHSLHIEGDAFACDWIKSYFLWRAPSGENYIMTANQVIRAVSSGKYVKYYSYDYVAE